MLKVSIIIPVLAINDYIRESMPEILKLNYQDFEIIILPNQKATEPWPKTKIIATNVSDAAVKRDIGAKHAHGEILAFIDDDAYPQADWLDKALKHFDNPIVAAVGGPAITPKNSHFFQKVSASVFESYLGSGTTRERYLPIGRSKTVDDWPSVNLLIRKDVFLAIGGFDSTFWPGEDTKLCLEVLKLNKKIIYDPEVIVYHHRRTNLIRHLQQIGNYGLHRGYFAKVYPQTSLKPFYFLPSLFALYIISFFIMPIFSKTYPFGMFYALPLGLYFVGLLIDGTISTIRYRNLLIGLPTMTTIFLTHFYYGLRFIQGLLVKKLKK